MIATPAPIVLPAADRRDFIHVAAGSVAAVGAGAVVWPLLRQMAPSADVLAAATIDLDLTDIEPGQAIVASWRGMPIFVHNLTPGNQAAANSFAIDQLRDPESLAERTKPGHANWLIMIGVCTHLGCVPLGGRIGENRGAYDGYFCPCHGSSYDMLGRIRQGPAPRNLDLPDYEFLTPTQVRIG
jgi:ubiquinol-cytochrome c reductase iron-sulfur subunit